MFGSKRINEEVYSGNAYERAAPNVSGEGQVHAIICALDYKQTSHPLTCSKDGKNMEKLLAQCGVQDVIAMYDNQCTKERVLNTIAEVGSRCDTDDYFIFYYSGHGTSVDDEDGDEDDGKDEAFCLVDDYGKLSRNTFLTDDEFAAAVIDAVDQDVRVLILTDCCHSGTIADLDKEEWGDIHAISITGCLDHQTSGDMGRGGIFTHSLLLAIDKLQDAGEEDYSVGLLHNATVEQDDKVFHSAQDITIQSTSAVNPDEMAWPLVPQGDYQAPLTKAMHSSGGKLSPEVLQQFGIPPHIANFVNMANLPDGIVPDDLMVHGIKCLADIAGKNGCAIM